MCKVDPHTSVSVAGFTVEDEEKLKSLSDSFRAVYARWIATLDTNWWKASTPHAIIAGGALASLWHHEAPKDWDMYFPSKEACKRLEDYYSVMPGAGDVTGTPNFKQDGYNAITVGDKVQLVTSIYGHSLAILKTFDYLHACWYWDSRDQKLWITPAILNAIKDKQLVVNNKERLTPERFQKFRDRGWTPRGK